MLSWVTGAEETAAADPEVCSLLTVEDDMPSTRLRLSAEELPGPVLTSWVLELALPPDDGPRIELMLMTSPRCEGEDCGTGMDGGGPACGGDSLAGRLRGTSI